MGKLHGAKSKFAEDLSCGPSGANTAGNVRTSVLRLVRSCTHHTYLCRREAHSMEGHPEEAELRTDMAQRGHEGLECRNNAAVSLGNQATTIEMNQPQLAICHSFQDSDS